MKMLFWSGSRMGDSMRTQLVSAIQLQEVQQQEKHEELQEGGNHGE